MSEPLRAWKDALEDLGVIGLIPEPLTVAHATAATEQGAAIHKAPAQEAAMTPAPPPKKAAPPPLLPAPKAKETYAWAAPSDPIKNPPGQSIENCDTLEALNACI
jgi:hypothetical protein